MTPTFQLRAWRRHRGQTLEALAKRSGVPKSSLHRFETGEVSPTLETMAKIAQALDASVEQLLGVPPGESPTPRMRRRR